MTMPLIDLALKGSVLLFLAGLLVWSARRATAAAQRHFVWTLALAGLLLLPAFASLPLRLEVLPTKTVEAVKRRRVEAEAPVAPAIAAEQPSAASSHRSVPRRSNASTSPTKYTLEQILTSVWLLGAALLLGRVALAFLAALWLTRSGREVTDRRWQLALAEAADDLGVLAPVRLVETARARIPMTFGARRPVIVLPEESFVWDDETRRSVLLHELAHIKRGDMLTCLLAQLVTACYWFNPLVWIAAYRLRLEAEQACDDMVLHAGATPSRYAEQLLAIVQAAGRSPVPALAMPMAQPSAFEGRILAILQPETARDGLTRRVALAGVALLFAVAVPLAALAPKAAVARIGGLKEKRPAPVSVALANPTTPVNPPSGAPPALSAGASPEAGSVTAGLLIALEDSAEEVRLAAAQALGERADTAAINALLEALRRDSSREVRRMAAWALGEIEDARAVSGLVAALREERDREVRLAIVRALGDIESADAVPGLGSALRATTDGEMQRAIVQALGEIESADAVPMLTGLLRGGDAELRQQAAWALGEIESAEAVAELSAALSAEQVDLVREQIVWALGEIEDVRAVPALERALRDASVEIRRKAAWALGEIDGIRRAPPGLVEALRDVDVEVRKAAAHALGELEDVSAVPGLVGALQGADIDLRRIIAHALGELPSAMAAQALVALLQDPDPEIRRAAAEALGNR